MSDPRDTVTRLGERLAQTALTHGVRVACAESLTGGQLSSALARAPQASEWFVGSVVAYSARVKHELLGVPPGPVVTAEAVEVMAREVAHLLGADLTVAVSGAGGPGPQDGNPPGTVWFAVHQAGAVTTECREFQSSPSQVVEQAVSHALRLLLAGRTERE